MCPTIDFNQVFHFEPRRKFLPNLRPQAVSVHQPDFVFLLFLRDWRRQHVSTQLTNVLGYLYVWQNYWALKSQYHRIQNTFFAYYVHCAMALNEYTIIKLSYRNVIFDAVLPEPRGWKLFLDDRLVAHDDRKWDAQLPTRRMVHG